MTGGLSLVEIGVKYITEKLGPYLFKMPAGEEISILKLKYNEILKYGNIIVLSESLGSLEDLANGILSNARLNTKGSYSDRNTLAEMKDIQFAHLVDFHYTHEDQALFLLSWTLTQSDKQALCQYDPFLESIRALAAQANSNFMLIEEESKKLGKLPNIVAADFVDGTSTLVAMKLIGIDVTMDIECSTSNDCGNHACGHKTAADNANLICCPSGETILYAARNYCSNMPNGSTCWSNTMCNSYYCKGNMGGLRHGTCERRHLSDEL